MSLVSIIIPCYNYAWSLPETLNSVIAQIHSDWECLIIDDGSKDDTKQVAQSYEMQDKRFRYIYQHNQGVSTARNRGLNEAKGEYIQFLDADDLLSTHKLATGLAYFDAHPTTDLVYGDVRYFLNGEPERLSRSMDMSDTEWMVSANGTGPELVNTMLENSFIVISGPLFRASLAQRVGWFEQDIPCMEDWHYWVRCAIAGARFKFDDSPLSWSLVRLHPGSVSQNQIRMYSYDIVVRKRLIPILESMKFNQALAINDKLINRHENH